jgi:hypothetical protein
MSGRKVLDIDIPSLPDRPVPLGRESFQSSLLNGMNLVQVLAQSVEIEKSV